MINDPQDILTFWKEAGPEKWFVKDPVFDAQIAEHFEDSFELACTGGYDDWTSTPEGALAVIIMLDQFSRNLYRDSPKAFAQDPKALEISKRALDAGLDAKMPEDLAYFSVMPLMHSENLDDQERCIAETKRMGRELKHAVEHRDIIKAFGRFPHRNGVLGRETTAEEKAFLDDGGFAG